MDGDNKVQTGQDGREAQYKGSQGCRQHIGPGFKAVRGIEGPTRIGRAISKKGDDHQDPTEHIDIPGKEVQPGKEHILGPDLDGQHEVAEHRGESGYNNQENHDHPMDRKCGIIGLGFHEGFSRCNQFQFHQETQHHTNNEPAHHGVEVEQADPFVVRGEDPFEDTLSPPVLLQVGFIPRTLSLRRAHSLFGFSFFE